MPDQSPVTRTTFDAALRRLNSGVLVAVRYFYTESLGDWDYGDRHEPSMGVELGLDDGPVLLTWGDAFGHFGLELWDAAGEAAFRNDPQRVDVSEHEWWSHLVGKPLVAVDLWANGLVDNSGVFQSTGRAPLAINLANTSGQCVWVVAAEVKSDAQVWFGADQVLVTPNGDWLTRAAPQRVRFD